MKWYVSDFAALREPAAGCRKTTRLSQACWWAVLQLHISFVAHLEVLDRDTRCALPRGLRVNDELSCRHTVAAFAYHLGSGLRQLPGRARADCGHTCQHGYAASLLLSMLGNVVSGSLIRRVAGGGQLGCSLYVFSNEFQWSDVESARANSGGLPRSLSTESKAVLALSSVASCAIALSVRHRRRGWKVMAVWAPHGV